MHAIYFLPVNRRKLALVAAHEDHLHLLIVGASGTGKMALAEWIHLNGPRLGKNFYVMTSEKPLSEQIIAAQSGTLVIEEFIRLSERDQVVLYDYLRKKVVPSQTHSQLFVMAKARIICTSSELRSGGFWHVNYVTRQIIAYLKSRIDVPHLRQRLHELDDIMLTLLKEITIEIQKEHVTGFSALAAHRLRCYDWPGNIREMRNILKVATIVAKSDRIQVEDLPDFAVNKKLHQLNRKNFEKFYLVELLRIFKWDVEKTSKMISMNKHHLASKIQDYGITAESAFF